MRRLRWLIGFCFAVLLVCGGGMAVQANITADGIHYEDNLDGTVYVNGYSGNSAMLVITSEIEGKKVRSVGGFEKNYELEYVTIQEGITTLNSSSFYSCENLIEVSLPSTVQEVDSYAFARCKRLTAISLPEGVQELQRCSFQGCVSLKNITIPNSLKVIGDNVFSGCSLEQIDLPDSIISIGEGAFTGCDFTSIKIPKGITSIGHSVFEYCDKLESIEIPENITSIGGYAFSSCISLRQITIPGNVQSIGKGCFLDCKNLQEVSIAEGIKRIEDSAFKWADGLRKVTVPDSVTQIGDNVFDYFPEGILPNMVLYANPDSYAREYASSNNIKYSCISHAALVRDEAVAPTCGTAGKTAGSHCTECGMVMEEQKALPPTGLHSWDGGTVTVSPTTTAAGVMRYVCRVCGADKHVTLPQKEKPSGGGVGEGGHEDVDPPREALKVGDVHLDERGFLYRVTRSGAKGGELEATGVRGAKGVMRIPASVTVKGTDCKVTSIGKGAFKGNRKLRSLTVGARVRRINAGAFSGCRNLREVVIRSKGLAHVGRNAFQGIHPKARIKVPPKKLKEYRGRLKGKGQKATVKIVK